MIVTMAKISKARLDRNGTDQLKVLENSDHKHQEVSAEEELLFQIRLVKLHKKQQ